MQTFNKDKIEDYVQSLCERNKDLNHNVDGNKSFARYQSESEMTDLRNAAAVGSTIVVVADFSARRVGDRDDKAVQWEMILRVVSYAINSTDEEIKAANNRAETVVMDIITEMERKQEADLDGSETCGILHYLRPEEMHWEPIEDAPWLVNHYGWDLAVPFRLFMPAYNADKWRAE